MMGEPRRIRTTKATSKRLSGKKATPAKSVGRPSGPPSTIVNLRISLDLLGRLDRYIVHLVHTAVSFASFFLTTLVERRLKAALLDACSTEKMQDYPLRV
jgi:hypothetical protein